MKSRVPPPQDLIPGVEAAAGAFRRSTLVRVSLAYFLLALIFTWPLVTQLTRQTPFLGLGYALLANANLIGEQLSQFASPFTIPRIFHPVGYTIHEGFWPSFLAWLLGLGRNPVLGINLSILLSFVLSGLGTFLLVSEFVRSRWAAFLAGIYFSFSAVHVANLPIYPVRHFEGLPWFLYALFLYRRTRSRRSLLILSSAFLISCLSSWYFAVFCGLIYGLFSLTLSIEERSIRKLIPPSLALTVCCLLLLPISPPALLGSSGTVTGGTHLTINASADLLSYVMPSPRHGLFGKTVDGWQRDWPGNRPLRANYLGTLSLLLALYGWWTGTWNRHWKVFLASLALLALLLSLGPVLAIGGYDGWTLASPDPPDGLRLPYSILVDIFPFSVTRATARYSFLVLLVGAVCLGVGYHRLGRVLLRGSWGRRALPLAILLVLVVELLPRWPMRLQTPIPAPDFHQQLHQQAESEAESFSLLELPFDNRSYRALYQAQSQPYPVLGGSIDKPFHRFAQEMRRYPFLAMLLRASETGTLEPYWGEDIFDDASSSYTEAVLNYFGIRYASVDRWAGHRLSYGDLYQPEPRSELIAQALLSHFSPHSEEHLARIFVRELRADWLFPRLGTEWGGLTDHGEYRSRILFGHEGRIEIHSSKELQVDVSIALAALLESDRELVVSLNGEEIYRGTVSPQTASNPFDEVKVEALDLQKGNNLLLLMTPEPPAVFSGPNGNQEVSFRLRSFSVLPSQS